jgi:flagellar assembly protein FliH
LKKKANSSWDPEVGMSLSKYYKNSPSFQAENLVKQEGKPSAGWIPSPAPGNHPFQNQKISPPPPSSNRSHPGNAEEVLPPTNTTGSPPIPKQVIPPPPPTPPAAQAAASPAGLESSIDLSKYIDRLEAENKISEAYRQGIKEGMDKSERDFGAATRAMLLTCQQLDTLRATIIANSSKQLQDFSLAIAEKILRLSVREQDHTIVATIEEALRRAVKSDEFTIHLHPDDYDTVTAKVPEIIAGISGLNNIVMRKDSTVERGGARIESDNCTIDATISSQFEMIREEVEKKN